MVRTLLLVVLCASCYGQVTIVDPVVPTGFDITHASSSYNYTLYRGTPSLWGNLNQGGYVEFPVTASLGSYALQLYYSNGTSNDGSADLSINGVLQPSASTTSTGNWSVFHLSQPATINLPAGSSILRIAASQQAQPFNLAGILLTPQASSLLTPANPLSGTTFYVNPTSEAAKNIGESCANGASIAKIAGQPQGVWFGNWNADPQADAALVIKAASQQGAVPIIVVYNIVNRDCGGASSGGSPNAAAYQAWIRGLADGIGNYKAVVILEPDALSQLNVQGCLSTTQQSERLSLFQYAISMFNQHAPNALVYLDAGHSGAVQSNLIAQDLVYAGIANVTGFALNVSNYETSADNILYGQQISALVSNKHFIIDTSRNGQGPTVDHQFCNPVGRGLGLPSRGLSLGSLDAYVWAQNPGTSDGSCNGGPPAGTFSVPIACTLAQNAVF